MKAKHTPGPWRVVKYPKVFSIVASNGRQIAIMTEHHGDCPEVPMVQFERSNRDAADAALIATAPEMLALLKELIRPCHRTVDDSDNTAVEAIEDLIAKAEGRES